MAVGERAGVHHATVLYHFGSSRELLLAVLDERDRQFLDLSQEVLRDGGLGVIENLPAVGRFNRANPIWAKLFSVLQVENLDADAEAHEYFRDRRKAGHELLRGALRKAKDRGEIRRDVDEGKTADTVLAFAAGIQIQHFLDPKHVDIVAVYEHFTDVLVRDLTRGV
jgi:AcrR family transcriptional regulator